MRRKVTLHLRFINTTHIKMLLDLEEEIVELYILVITYIMRHLNLHVIKGTNAIFANYLIILYINL